MSKKLLAMLAAFTMALSFAACGNNSDDEDDNKKAKTTTTQAAEDESSEEEEESSEDESSEEEASSEDASSEASSEGDSSEAEKGSSDISDILDSKVGAVIACEETSRENPAKVGQWVKVPIYNAVSKKYEAVYTRIVKSASRTDDEKYVNDAIALNNEVGSDYDKVDEKELKIPSDCELCVVDYEVYVPEEFSADDWGIIAPDVGFSATNREKGGFESADGTVSYIGLGSIMDLKTSKESEKYKPGNVYKFRGLHLMVKGNTDYLYTYETYKEGTEDISEDTRINGYHECK